MSPALRGSILAVALVGAVVGCAETPRSPSSEPLQRCVEALDDMETRAAAIGLSPGSPRPIEGYPELATNRVLGGLPVSEMTAQEQEDWVQRLFELGAERRRLLDSVLRAHESVPATGLDIQSEATNQTNAGADHDPNVANLEALEACADKVFRERTWDKTRLTALHQAAQVPDEYSSVARVLGLYPLTSVFAGQGVKRLQSALRADFEAPLDSLPVDGRLQRFAPARRAGAVSRSTPPLLSPTASDGLGVRLSRIDPPTLEALIAYHAPVLEVDVAGPFDRLGTPAIDETGRPAIDTQRASAYHYVSVAPFAGRLRLQLVYVFWFSERPKESVFDSLGGRFDGIVWRVTVNDQGDALIYDSIHPCGCYHQFFLNPAVVARAGVEELPEPPLIPQDSFAPSPGQRMVLRLASTSHYLSRVYAEPPSASNNVDDGLEYKLWPYADLYALSSREGRSSFFDDRGYVPGSQRGERFYLWPMGVRSPGAMRDRGRQATAFLGRRHFDDADLFDRLFVLQP